MTQIKDLTINESTFTNEDGSLGKIAVFIYSGSSDPSPILKWAVNNYVEDEPYFELISSSLDNPWMRVVISNINKMKQESFNKDKHKLKL